MENEETMIGTDETMTEDLPDGLIEDEDASEETLEESLEEETPEESAEEQPKTEGTTEPGYVKKRIDKAVAKAIAETRAEMTAEFERQMAPFREKLLEDEAKELVRQGEFKSLDRAKEYLRLKQGQPAEEQPKQPRDSKGQYAPKSNPAQEAQINMLAKQADKIKASTGIDVIDIMTGDDEIRDKIMKGELDFYDVAEMAKAQKTGRKPPAPMRSPNGASGQTPNAIDQMSDAQFKRLMKRIDEGARITLK